MAVLKLELVVRVSTNAKRDFRESRAGYFNNVIIRRRGIDAKLFAGSRRQSAEKARSGNTASLKATKMSRSQPVAYESLTYLLQRAY